MKPVARIVLILWMSVLPACGRAALHRDVQFRVTGEALAVRASFSGDIDENGIERIGWEEGDRLRILSPQAIDTEGGDSHWADYRIKEIRDEGRSSLAGVEPAGRNGLAWGEGAHDFFAAFPSPADDDGTYLDGSVYHGFIPVVQDNERICLLASARGIEANREDPVRLVFRPAFTALSFTLSLEDDNPVPLHSFRLISTEGPVAGPFRVTWENEEDWSVETEGETSCVVDIGLNRTLERGAPLTVTVLCLPLDLSGLKAVFETGYGTKSLTLSLKDGTPILFPACHKARITGLVLPGAPDISFSVETAPWNESREEIEAEPSTLEND